MKTEVKPKAKATKTIVVVDDDADLRTVLTLLLSEAGYEAIGAEHALAAVFAAVRARPDLVLVDIRMPIMNGLELVKELKSHRDTHGIPLVAMTGHDSPEIRSAAIEAGCVGFLPKPFEPNRVLDQIKEWVK
jgi:two-component system cell cycle response regulator DivK